MFTPINFPTKEQREENKKYKVYCSVCDCYLEYEGFIIHEGCKKHYKALKELKKLNYDDVIDIINKTHKILKETGEKVECKSIDISKEIMKRNFEREQKDKNNYYCDCCEKILSKKNIQKHFKTEKHILKSKLN